MTGNAKTGCTPAMWGTLVAATVVLLIAYGGRDRSESPDASSSSDEAPEHTRALEAVSNAEACFRQFEEAATALGRGRAGEDDFRHIHQYCREVRYRFGGGACGDALSGTALAADQVADALEQRAGSSARRDALYFAGEARAAIAQCRPELSQRRSEAEAQREAAEAEASKEVRQAGGSGTPIPVPSDPRASYTLISIEPAENGLISVTNRRDGPSGESYARRLVDCSRMRFRYTGDSDTFEGLRDSEPGAPLSELVEGSISYHVSRFACERR